MRVALRSILARVAPRRRARTPTMLQMEAVECGAACLGMVLASFGRHVPLEELRLACGVSRDGTKASNLVRAARAYGLIAKGFTKEPAGLLALPLPLIVFWNFNHFVVVEGFGRRKVAINDPSSGPRAVSQEEFDQSFTGVVLTFEPGPDFAPGGAARNVAASLRQRLRGLEPALAYVALVTLALLVPGVLIPAFTRAFVDGVLANGAADRLRPLALAMIAAGAVNGLLTYLQQSYLLRLEHSLALRMSGGFFWHVLRLPIAFFTQRASGEIASRVQLNDTVAELLSARLATALFNMLLVIFYALALLSYDVPLTLIGSAVVLLNLVVLRLVARRRIDSTHKLLQDAGKLMGTATAGLQMIETIKASGAEPALWRRWAGHHAQVEQARQQLALHSQLFALVPVLLLGVNAALILTLGALRVLDGRMTVGTLAAFQALMLSFIAPVQSLVNLGAALQDAQAGLGRLDDVLHAGLDPALAEPAASPDAAPLSGRLSVSGLSFGYSRLEPPLISGVALEVLPGQRVAIVGGSGSGKSTLARLIAGLHQPWAGEVRFDGKLRPEIEPAAFQRAVSLVDQDWFLFDGSLRDNLTLWDESISEEDLMAALRDAGLEALLRDRPGGLDGPVAEGGRNFSGGQRQRLELARALARNPRLLILDEATNALDALTEQGIEAALRRRGCACLVIAHRLNTIRDCDEIIVIDQGAIVQRGSHAELIGQPGLYAQLIEAA